MELEEANIAEDDGEEGDGTAVENTLVLDG